jgi:hypothetical protein
MAKSTVAPRKPVTDAKDSGNYVGAAPAPSAPSLTGPTPKEAERAFRKPYTAPITTKINATVGNAARNVASAASNVPGPIGFLGNAVNSFLGPKAIDNSTSPEFNAGFEYGQKNFKTYGPTSFGMGPNQNAVSYAPSGANNYPAAQRYLDAVQSSFSANNGQLPQFAQPQFAPGSSMYAPAPGPRAMAVNLPSAPGGDTWAGQPQPLFPRGKSSGFYAGAMNGAKQAVYDWNGPGATGMYPTVSWKGRNGNFADAYGGGIFGYSNAAR